MRWVFPQQVTSLEHNVWVHGLLISLALLTALVAYTIVISCLYS